MAPADLLGVLTGFAKGGQVNDFCNSAVILDLLGRFYGGIVEALEFESFEPELGQTADRVTEPSAAIISWCNGFMLGVDHYKPAWESWFKDARRTKAISLIAEMLAPEMLNRPANALDDESAWVTITRISELVPLIHAYWTFESALDGYLADRE
jgi:hypothetical protein